MLHDERLHVCLVLLMADRANTEDEKTRNRSIPGCLKNAIDLGSRPQGKNVFDGLPAGVVSVTPYKMGAFGANHALRQTFAFLNMLVMQQPEAYIGGVADLFDEKGALKSGETKTFFDIFLGAFDSWVHRFAD
jgi:NAD(P)H-dependent FMN reductase